MTKKMVIIRQKDVKDCGPCCLESIIRFYDGYVSLEKIREDSYTSLKGTSVYHLVNAARKYGFDVVAKNYLDKKISNTIFPCIAHMHYENGLEHFVCIYNINDKIVTLMDPAKGKIKVSKEVFDKNFTGVVIELYPKSNITYLKKESSLYKLFINILKDNKKIIINLFLSSLILTIFTIISGLYFKIMYEHLQNNSYINSLYFIIYLFLIIVILKVVYNYLKNYYENHLNKNIDVNIISNFISHIFKLPLKVINTRSTGEIISRVNELNNIKELFSKIFVTLLLDLILLLGSLIILFYVNVKLSLILLFMLFLYIIVNILFNPYLYSRINKNIDYQTEFNSILIENIELINSLKNLNKIDFANKKNESKLSYLIYDNYSFTNIINIFITIRDLIIEIGIFTINTYGFYLIMNNKLSFIDLVLFNTLMYYVIDPIKNLISYIPKINFLRASFRKICDFIDIEEEILGSNEKFINGDILYKDISFSYNGYNENIKNFNLNIKCGEKLLIKGKSGSGKSTICNLLTRFYNPLKGSIYIANKNILDYNINTIRNNIVYVGQKEKLYSDTIKNNILFGNSKTLDFDKVCKVCLIEDIVNKKQFRYDFGIDNNFANLSGGEKQRIILARALLQNKKIIILDEALSELDYELERRIIDNIKKEYKESTIIYISHKKQDDLFDRVINFEEVNGVYQL